MLGRNHFLSVIKRIGVRNSIIQSKSLIPKIDPNKLIIESNNLTLSGQLIDIKNTEIISDNKSDVERIETRLNKLVEERKKRKGKIPSKEVLDRYSRSKTENGI